jgi:hypothetical protein
VPPLGGRIGGSRLKAELRTGAKKVEEQVCSAAFRRKDWREPPEGGTTNGGWGKNSSLTTDHTNGTNGSAPGVLPLKYPKIVLAARSSHADNAPDE